MGVNEDWNSVLKLNKRCIKRDSTFSPMLFLRKGEETTMIAILGYKNGDALKRVIKNILKKDKPDSYIFAFTGWGTEFGVKVFGEYPEYEYVVDMPLDDRFHTYVQLQVVKEYGKIRSFMAGIDLKGRFVKPDEGDLESKFVLTW